ERAGCISAQHRFSGPGDKRKTRVLIGRFPFPKQIDAVKLGVAAGAIVAESAGSSRHDSLRIAQIKRSGVTRHKEHVAQTFDAPLRARPAEEGLACIVVAKAVHRWALAVLNCQ